MSLVVNHNLMAMNAARTLGDVYSRLGSSTAKLASGLRINSAADDAAGLAIRELMRADIAVLNQGVRNAGDAISMIQTAEGAMSVIDEKLIRMKELAEQAATGTYTTAQREIMNSEYQAMAAEIDRIANATDFNGVKLLDGSLGVSHEGSGMKIHFGAGNSSAEDYYFIKIADMRATEETGLRVGNSDKRDTLRTTALNATSSSQLLKNAADTTDGYFGIRWSEDFNSNSAASSSWSVYGYVFVDTSEKSIDSLVADINQGRAAQGTMTFNTISDSTVLGQQSLTLNGQVFTFTSALGTSSYNATAGTGVIALTTSSASSIAMSVAAYVNTHAASIGVYAAPDSASSTAVGNTTLHFVATEFGETGNSINTVGGTTLMQAAQEYLSGGGEKVVTASAYYDAKNNEYELQIQMNRGGEKYQLQVFNITTLGGFPPSIVGGGITNTSLGSTWGGVLPTNVGGTTGLASYGSTDESDEWIQAQNGTGRTTWNGADILTQSAAQLALGALDTAINKKDSARAGLGALQNRLENTITNLQIQAENLQAAESRISDVDVATEMTEFTRNNILAQAAVAMLAQANSLPTLALSLLGG